MLRFYVRQNKCSVCDFRKFVCAQRDHKRRESEKKELLGGLKSNFHLELSS